MLEANPSLTYVWLSSMYLVSSAVQSVLKDLRETHLLCRSWRWPSWWQDRLRGPHKPLVSHAASLVLSSRLAEIYDRADATVGMEPCREPDADKVTFDLSAGQSVVPDCRNVRQLASKP